MEMIGKEVEVLYEQEEDCCGRAEVESQYLRAFTRDGGGGYYVVIGSRRWAFDGRNAGHELIDRICDDLGLPK